MIARVRSKLDSFRRKLLVWALYKARQHLEPSILIEALDPYWWELVRLEMKKLTRSPMGVEIASLLFVKDEGMAVDGTGRDVRDIERDVRGDRTS